MVTVKNYVGGAFASSKAAKQSLKLLQPLYVHPLRVVRKWHTDTFLYYIVHL